MRNSLDKVNVNSQKIGTNRTRTLAYMSRKERISFMPEKTRKRSLLLAAFFCFRQLNGPNEWCAFHKAIKFTLHTNSYICSTKSLNMLQLQELWAVVYFVSMFQQLDILIVCISRTSCLVLMLVICVCFVCVCMCVCSRVICYVTL